MARIAVIGGGYGGLASALRLAKTGHRVTLIDADEAPGGALRPIAEDGFAWDASATTTLLPAAMRDLFRKTGRPIERELDLEPVPVIREHRFVDGSSVRLPGGSRADQIAAFDELGDGFGHAWAEHTAAFADDWEILRKHYLEVPWDRDALPRDVATRLKNREHLHRRLKRDFSDERLRLVAGHPFVAAGQVLRDVPSWMGLTAYLEQRFGAWRVAGEPGLLADVLTKRLVTRRVDVLSATTARDLVLRDGRAVAVATDVGQVDTDAVVCAIDPRRLPALQPHVAKTMPALPPIIVHLGLEGEVPEIGHELVLHGDPTIVIRPGGTAPDGHTAWTLHVYGKLLEDVLTALARHKIDVREQDVARVQLSPADLVAQWHGSPLGVRWEGRGTAFKRLGPTTPITGVYAAGAHATPGSGLPFVALSAALVAQVIGPA